jgi:hypothetical protein
MDPAGRRLKIPIWMLLPECAEITISKRPCLGKQALLCLASLISSQLDSKDPVHDLRQTRVSGFAGGRCRVQRWRSRTSSASINAESGDSNKPVADFQEFIRLAGLAEEATPGYQPGRVD